MKFLELVKVVRALFSIGMPPAIENESALRKWIGDLVDMLKGLAVNTAVEIDDTLTSILEKIVANDTAWNVAYALLKLTDLADSNDDSGAVADRQALAEQVGSTLTPEGQVCAINPILIMQIIATVIQAIKMFRESRN